MDYDAKLKALERRMKCFFSISILCSVLVNPIITAVILSFGKPARAASHPDIPVPSALTTSSPARAEWLTTTEVAAREHIARRTLIDWIASARLHPPPYKSSRTWHIPANYEIRESSRESTARN